jgi:hypothetical protein
MPTFTAAVQDLEDATSYERGALEFLRATTLRQSEASNGLMSVTLGDLTSDGRQHVHMARNFHADLCEGAVIAALHQMRPLAFSAAFKLHDMIAEWILRANGSHAWPFAAKAKDYDNFVAAGAFLEPPLFALWPALSSAFWEAYKHLFPYRNALTHGGGIRILPDGTLEIRKGATLLTMTSAHQASYIRAMCLLARHLIAQDAFAGVDRHLIETDFAILRFMHSQTSLVVRSFRVEGLSISVPQSIIPRGSPVHVTIDFDFFRKVVEEHCPVAPGGALLLSVEVQAENASHRFRWYFPPESVPVGKCTLKEDTARIEVK